jgi:hypothetical protein
MLDNSCFYKDADDKLLNIKGLRLIAGMTLLVLLVLLEPKRRSLFIPDRGGDVIVLDVLNNPRRRVVLGLLGRLLLGLLLFGGLLLGRRLRRVVLLAGGGAPLRLLTSSRAPKPLLHNPTSEWK